MLHVVSEGVGISGSLKEVEQAEKKAIWNVLPSDPKDGLNLYVFLLAILIVEGV